MGVQQALMRHADIGTTMNTYGKAMLDTKRLANSKVVTIAMRPSNTAQSMLGVSGSLNETAEAM